MLAALTTIAATVSYLCTTRPEPAGRQPLPGTSLVCRLGTRPSTRRDGLVSRIACQNHKPIHTIVKKIITGSLLIALGLATAGLTASAATFGRDLSLGATGDSVIQLQQFLTSQNLYAAPITGNFFSLTLAGVRKFQASQASRQPAAISVH
nr:hypothetical protein [uncultured bacterium]